MRLYLRQNTFVNRKSFKPVISIGNDNKPVGKVFKFQYTLSERNAVETPLSLIGQISGCSFLLSEIYSGNLWKIPLSEDVMLKIDELLDVRPLPRIKSGLPALYLRHFFIMAILTWKISLMVWWYSTGTETQLDSVTFWNTEPLPRCSWSSKSLTQRCPAPTEVRHSWLGKPARNLCSEVSGRSKRSSSPEVGTGQLLPSLLSCNRLLCIWLNWLKGHSCIARGPVRAKVVSPFCCDHASVANFFETKMNEFICWSKKRRHLTCSVSTVLFALSLVMRILMMFIRNMAFVWAEKGTERRIKSGAVVLYGVAIWMSFGKIDLGGHHIPTAKVGHLRPAWKDIWARLQVLPTPSMDWWVSHRSHKFRPFSTIHMPSPLWVPTPLDRPRMASQPAACALPTHIRLAYREGDGYGKNNDPHVRHWKVTFPAVCVVELVHNYHPSNNYHTRQTWKRVKWKTPL